MERRDFIKLLGATPLIMVNESGFKKMTNTFNFLFADTLAKTGGPAPTLEKKQPISPLVVTMQNSTGMSYSVVNLKDHRQSLRKRHSKFKRGLKKPFIMAH